MRSARTYLSPLLACTALLAMLAACNDNPTTVGDGLLSQDVHFTSYALKQDEIEIVGGISIASNSNPESGAGIVVGRTADGITAHGLVAITSQSPLISGSTAYPMRRASLAFHTGRYRIGDTSTRKLAFDVVVLDGIFASNEKWSASLASRIEAAPSIGSFDGTYDDDSTLTVQLDSAPARQFLQEYFRLDNNTEGQTFVTLKTLAIRPRAGTAIACELLGIAGVDEAKRPQLSVTVIDGTADDSTITLPVGTTSWIADAPVETGPGKLVVMGGLSVRSLIRLRLDSIPPTATIHSAELRLTLDPANSRVGTLGQTNYLVAYLAADSSLNTSSYLYSGIPGIFPVNRIPVTEGDTSRFTNVFRFTTLSPAVASWLRKARGGSGFSNHGVILAMNRGSTGPNIETTTLDRYVFFGADATDPALRPSLTIYYTLQTDAK